MERDSILAFKRQCRSNQNKLHINRNSKRMLSIYPYQYIFKSIVCGLDMDTSKKRSHKEFTSDPVTISTGCNFTCFVYIFCIVNVI